MARFGQQWGGWLLAGCLASLPAWAQSEALREQVRLHRPGATAQALAELQACRTQSQPPCDAVDRLVLLAGTLQLGDGEAAAALGTLGSRPPAGLLEAHHHFALGEAALATEDAPRAVAHFAKAADRGSPPLAARARVRHGEALLAAGKAAEALPLLDAELKRGHNPKLLADRARALTLVGRKDDARRDWEQLALRSPTHALAEEALAALAGPKGRPWVPAAGDRLDRAERLQAAGRHAQALAEAEALSAQKGALPTATDKARLALLQARSLTATGKDASAAWKRALTGPDAIAVKAAWDQARQLLRGSDRAATRKAMRGVQDRFPKAAEADDALYYLAWLHLQDGQFDEAVQAFDELFEKHPRSSLRDDAAWFQALARIEQGQNADAIAKLEALIKRFPRSQLVPQARYWIVRLRQLTDPKEDVSAAYAAVIREAPETWYALMAARRLEELGKKPPAGFPKPPSAGIATATAAKSADLALARELSAAALFQEASEEVRFRIGAVKGVSTALALGHALAEFELHGDAYALAARHLWGQAYTRKDPAALALLYPQAYADSVRAAAKGASIEPSLVWAIMRRESAFRPSAHSHANARGLMQLIPPTATAIAAKLGEPAPDPDGLFAPGVNVRYASWYLAQLLERFGHPALAAAAYNGGPSAVARWLERSGALPLDLFVERIPYKETRRYVKKVLADAHLYQRFYGAADVDALSLSLPAPKDDGVNF